MNEQRSFFDAHQRETVEAAMARIIPTDRDPGAREAGSVDFVDRYLSGIGFVYAKPDGSGFETLTGMPAQSWRRRIDIMRARYAEGIAALDAFSEQKFRAHFCKLGESQQDEVLHAMELAGKQKASAGGPPGEGPALQQTFAETELEFLPLLVLHTRQGFYADPVYGGNRDHIGWKVIGFPGPTSLNEVFTGQYSALPWFAEGEAEKYWEANRVE